MDKKPILFLSDFGHTGIAESVSLPAHHFHESEDHEVWSLVLGFNGWVPGIDKSVYPWYERVLMMHGGELADPNLKFGQICLDKAIRLSKAKVIVTSFDVWMAAYLAVPQHTASIVSDEKRFNTLGHHSRDFTHIAYFPLDGLVENKWLPRHLDEWIAGFDIPVTYSRFARDAVYRTLGLEIPFIPICHDPKVFCPGDRSLSRAQLKLPQDKFLIGMVATNQSRKLWGEFIEVSAALAHKYDDVIIIPWTTWDLQINGGADITDLVFRNDLIGKAIDPEGQVGKYTDEGMAHLYRALDVLVLTTVGEGAGLPPIRARACGTPALVSDNTSNTEFTGHSFERVKSYPSHLSDGSNLQRFSTDRLDLFTKLEQLYLDRKFRDEVGATAAYNMRQYEKDKVLPLWDAVVNVS